MTVTWTVCNQGTAFTDAPFGTIVALYRDPNRTQLVRDYGTYPNLAYLGPGECYHSRRGSPPHRISGPHFFAVQSDSANDVYELIENNNNLSSVTPTPVTYVPPSFLHVSSVSVAPSPPTAVWAGDKVVVSYTIKNTGGSPIPANSRTWDHAFAIAPGSSWQPQNVVAWHRDHRNGPLLPGEIYTGTEEVTIPSNITARTTCS